MTCQLHPLGRSPQNVKRGGVYSVAGTFCALSVRGEGGVCSEIVFAENSAPGRVLRGRISQAFSSDDAPFRAPFPRGV